MKNNKKMHNKRNCHCHAKGCRYQDDDKLLYAKIELNNHRYLISAMETALFDKYLGMAKKGDRDISIDEAQSDKEPFQIVYGAMMYNEWVTLEKVFDLAKEMRGYAFMELEEDRVNISGYQDIVFYPEDAIADNYIPFAALMQMPHRLENMGYSITLFPALKGYTVWENMINRPFLLACRESFLYENSDTENWEKYIEKEKLMKAYQCADLLTE